MDMQQVPACVDNTTGGVRMPNWYDIHPKPRSAPASVSPAELEALIKTKDIGKDYLVVDVRKSDFVDYCIPGAINLPAQSFHPTLPGLLPILSKVPLVIFHCQSCGKETSRGRLVAAWYQDALDDAQISGSRAGYLEGGIKGWIETYKGKEEEGLIKKL